MCQETLPRGKVQISRVNKTILFIFNYFALCIKEFPQRDFATFLDYSDKDNDTLQCNKTFTNDTFRNKVIHYIVIYVTLLVVICINIRK